VFDDSRDIRDMLVRLTRFFCGRKLCVQVYPTNALKPKREWLMEQDHSPQETLAMTKSEKRRRRK